MTRLIFISDTHNVNEKILVPNGDILIHCGDVTNFGTEWELGEFIKWFASLPHPNKIFIAGNHDAVLAKTRLIDGQFYIGTEVPTHINLPSNVHYLNDTGVTIEGIRFWGSPVQPTYGNMAFNIDRGEPISKHWEKIPNDVDVLLTHGPVEDVLDLSWRKINCGCADLKKKVLEIKPKIHAFGHIHEGYGVDKIGDTLFVNAAVVQFRGVNYDPIVVDMWFKDDMSLHYDLVTKI